MKLLHEIGYIEAVDVENIEDFTTLKVKASIFGKLMHRRGIFYLYVF